MKAISVACAALVSSLMVGCVASDGDVGDDANGGGKADGDSIIGTYRMDNDAAGGTLTIKRATQTRIEFDLTVVNKGGGNNFGELAGEFQSASGAFTFSEGDDCTIALARSGETIRLDQTGSCVDAGFGAFVSATGAYVLERPLPTSQYRMDHATAAGTLDITSVAQGKIGFTLFVVRKTGGNNHGEISGEFLENDAGELAFVEGDNCRIAFRRRVDKITLQQTGSCADAGFGAFVDASGDYLLQRPPAVGTFKMSNADFSGTLVVKSVTAARVAFDLTVVRRSGGNNFGELSGELTNVNGSLSYTEGDDCEIDVASTGTQLALTQIGSCVDAGFGSFVDASGDYVKQ